MSFHLAIRHRYPGAVRQREYVSVATAALHRAGYRPDNTLAAVSHCRDELTSSLRVAVESSWGPAFELSGLAGLLSSGATGMSAALSHLPDTADRAGFVVFAFSHVGIDDDGTIGVLRRPGMHAPTATCGSLAGVLAYRQANQARRNARDRVDALDLEQWNVTKRIDALLPSDQDGGTPDLADLADLALRCIEADVNTIFERLVGHHPDRPLGVDGALFTGVQIHGPGDQHYVWPSVALVDVGGVVTEAMPDRDLTDHRPQQAEPQHGRQRHPEVGRPEPSRAVHRHVEHGHYDPARTHTEHRHTEHTHTEHTHTEHTHTRHERWDPEGERRRRARSNSIQPARPDPTAPEPSVLGRLWAKVRASTESTPPGP